MIDLDALQNEVGKWCNDRFRSEGRTDDVDILTQTLAVAEEGLETTERLVGRLLRLVRAVLKRDHGGRPGTDWDAEVRIESADLIITLLNVAHKEGWSLADALTERWEVVRNR